MIGDLTPAPYRARMRRRRADRRMTIGSLSVIAAAVLGSLAGLGALRAERSPLAGSVAELERQVAAMEAASQSLRDEARRLEASLRRQDAARSSPDWAILFRAVAQRTGSEVRLAQISLTVPAAESDPPTLVIRGASDEVGPATRLAARLASLPVFRSAGLASARRGPDGAVRFELVATLEAQAQPGIPSPLASAGAAGATP